MKNILSLCLIICLSLTGCAQENLNVKGKETETPVVSSSISEQNMHKTEEEWKALLTPEQFRVLRQKGTESPYTGIFDKHVERGVYTCAGCGAVLFSSDEKYDAGCGWPSFSDAAGKSVKTHQDNSLGMIRTEITCASCGGHSGHVFDDGPKPTGRRYCVNSASLDFKPEGVNVSTGTENRKDD